jgi:hypothetical protein
MTAKDTFQALGAVLFVVLIFAIFVFALATSMEDPDPNKVCAGRGGVEKVYQSGNAVNGVVCRDGFYKNGND